MLNVSSFAKAGLVYDSGEIVSLNSNRLPLSLKEFKFGVVSS
ncbi:hypothetical protein [Campylobacter vicugnae]|nr:hypothetical protein [Campylobacter sp. RM12175]